MLTATFMFEADPDLAGQILFQVSRMSGVRPTAIEGGISVIIYPPFGEPRLDNVENVIRGLGPDVARV
jgi:hypothetical protein